MIPPLLLAIQSDDSLNSPTEEIGDAARNLWESVLDAVPRVGVAIVIVLFGWVLSRGVRWVLRRILRRSDQTPSFVTVMSKVGGWIVLLVAILGAITATFPSVKPVDLLAGLGFLSVAVGFAFQDILENTMSGILLLFRQPFESGDQIEVQEQTGTVEAITIRETRIKTFDGQLVVIPNRDVYKSVIRVQTHYEDRRIDFAVGIAYENDAARACEITARMLATVEGVASTPPPEALVNQLGVSTVNIEARFWCSPRQHDGRLILDRAIKAVKVGLGEAEIEMPADIIVLQATPSFRAALQGDAEVTPGGGVRRSAEGPATGG